MYKLVLPVLHWTELLKLLVFKPVLVRWFLALSISIVLLT